MKKRNRVMTCLVAGVLVLAFGLLNILVAFFEIAGMV